MLNLLAMPFNLINFIHVTVNTFYHSTQQVCLVMLDHGTLPLNNFIALSWMLLVVLAVGTGIPNASAADNICSFKSQYTLVFSYLLTQIQGVSRLVDITAGGDFLGLCDQKTSYKHVSDFGRLRSYDRLKLRIEGNDY